MPVYEYICKECQLKFEAILTMKEHEEMHLCCPRCNSRNVEQEVAEFFAVTSRKS